MTHQDKQTIWFLFFKNVNFNEYDRFLQLNEKKAKPIEKFVEYHLHHIIPKYWFFENPSYLTFLNKQCHIIYLSRSDHAVAHLLLYKLLNDTRDLSAFYMLRFNKTEALKQYRIAGAKATHLLLKNKNLNFWNSETQKSNAKKSLAKIDALLTRSLGGKKGGYQRNKNRLITKTTKILFLFEYKPFLCIFNCQTGGDVLKILNKAKPSNMKRISPLLNGKRKKAYGWSCVILIENKKS